MNACGACLGPHASCVRNLRSESHCWDHSKALDWIILPKPMPATRAERRFPASSPLCIITGVEQKGRYGFSK